MTEVLPAIIQSIGLVQDHLEDQQVVEVRLKLSTGVEHRVHLQPGHPLLNQITTGKHVLAVLSGPSQAGQQRFVITTNYGDGESGTV